MDKYLRLVADMKAEDLAGLFDTGVFNGICRAYMAMAMDGAGIDREARQKALDELTECFESTAAEEALKYYRSH